MIIFKYKREPSRLKGQFIQRPVAEIYLQTKSKTWLKFNPYIDSGADVTLIPLSLGKLIGLTVDEKRIEQIGGIRGSVPVIYFKSDIKIGDIQFPIQIARALIEEVPPLLGRTDVFDKFNVQFRQKEGIIVFEEIF